MKRQDQEKDLQKSNHRVVQSHAGNTNRYLLMEDLFAQYSEIIEFRTALSQETDRGCALMAASYLDQELRSLIYSNLAEDKDIEKQLFEGNGALATFSSRIAMAYAMGLISPAVRRDLNLVRKIRNIFGHDAKPIDFTDPAIACRCRELYFRYESLEKPPRRFFENAAMGIAAHVHMMILRAVRPTPPDDARIDDKIREEHVRKMEDLFGGSR